MKHILKSKTKITNVDDQMIQPNALDVRLDQVYEIQSNLFVLSEESREHRSTTEIQPDAEGYFLLKANHKYSILLDHNVEIGDGEAGWLIPRSSLNRNGLFVTSGLYDSGFYNQLGGVLHVGCGDAKIKKGTRVAQFILFDAEAVSLYDGVYNKGERNP